MSNRLDTLTSWRADWSGLRVAVLGAEASGFAVADTLTELGAQVLVAAEEIAEDYARLVPVIGAELLVTDLHEAPAPLAEFAPELLVASPDFGAQHPLVLWAREQDIAVWGDVELAWRVRDKVTRADGSAAEWMLLAGNNADNIALRAAEMLQAGGVRAAPCGTNVPVLDAVRDPAGFDALVVTLSAVRLSQLAEAAEAGQPVPFAALCMGADSEELDETLYRHCRVACVYNKADSATVGMVEEADVIEGARAIGVDLGAPGPSDFGIVDGILVDRAFLDDRRHRALELTTVDELESVGLSGPAAVREVLAASALARAAGVDPAVIASVLRGPGL